MRNKLPRESVKSMKIHSQKPVATAEPKHAEIGKTLRANTPKHGNPQLQELERGRQWKQLHEQGLSLAVIAETFACSKTLARDLVDLASLPKDLEEAYLQGKMGRKAVLEMARKRRQKESGTKANQKVTAGMVPTNSRQDPAPSMTEAERQAKIADLVPIVVEWVNSLSLTAYDLESFWDQVNTALYRGCHWLFTDEAQNGDKISSGEDPMKVIERCKVTGGTSQLMPEIINNHVTWLARWIQRLIPDWVMMKEALAQAEAQLRREVQTTRWN